MTRQRQVVWEELARVHTHPTADQVYARVRRKLPHVSLSTVYRNLERMAEDGQVVRLDLAGQQRRYDADTHDHYHVCCVACGRVDDLPIRVIEGVTEAALGKTAYDIMGYRLKFLGRCPECKNVGKTAGNPVSPQAKGRPSHRT